MRWTNLLFLQFLHFGNSAELLRLPIVDISPLIDGTVEQVQAIGQQIGEYCRNVGFFYISGHGIDLNLQSVCDILCDLLIEC
jgi:hypothetical protein